MKGIARYGFFAAALLACCGPAATVLRAEDAPALVRKGIERFRKGDYEGAGEAFARADVARPDDPRITFDRACVLAGKQDLDKAMDLFRAVALTRDPALAAAARYNLGILYAEKAKALFGEHPEDVEAAVRGEGLNLLFSAVKHFRECLAVDPEHEDARHNLELLRLWIKNMQALWAQRDREKARREMNLLQFLQMMEERQTELRRATRALAGEEDSPKRRQEVSEIEGAQRALADEVDPLKKKIDAEVAGPPVPAGGQASGKVPSTAATTGDRAKAAEVLKGWADEAKDKMVKAADLLKGGTPEDAVEPQEGVVEAFDRIFGAAAPFPSVLEKARELQKAVKDHTASLGEAPPEGTEGECRGTAWSEDRVGNLSRILGLKAQEGLRRPPPVSAGPGKGAPSGAATEKASKAQEKLKKAMKKAVDLCPRIRTLTGKAAGCLRAGKAAEALPPEEKALALLEEIAKELPEEKKPSQDEGGKQPKNDRKKRSEGQGKTRDKGKDGASRRQNRLSREEAEAILRKAEEREREYRRKREALMRALRPPAKVDKDW